MKNQEMATERMMIGVIVSSNARLSMQSPLILSFYFRSAWRVEESIMTYVEESTMIYFLDDLSLTKYNLQSL